MVGEPAQLAIDQGHQFFECLAVPLSPKEQQFGYRTGRVWLHLHPHRLERFFGRSISPLLTLVNVENTGVIACGRALSMRGQHLETANTKIS
jgi:hypothetical protein